MACKGSEVEEAEDKSVTSLQKALANVAFEKVVRGRNERGEHKPCLLVFAKDGKQCIRLWQFIHLLTTDTLFQSVQVRQVEDKGNTQRFGWQGNLKINRSDERQFAKL